MSLLVRKADDEEKLDTNRIFKIRESIEDKIKKHKNKKPKEISQIYFNNQKSSRNRTFKKDGYLAQVAKTQNEQKVTFINTKTLEKNS